MAIRTNIRRLDRRLRKVTEALNEFVVGIQRNIIEEVATEVVARTPVDTGFARGNWIAGINAPPLVPVTTLDPTALAAPARISSLAQFLRPNDTFFIVNNATYIELLNRGYSPQAPPGFITIAVTLGVQRGIAKTRSLRVRR